MSSYQLGVVGVVLIAVNLVAEGIVGTIGGIHSTFESHIRFGNESDMAGTMAFFSLTAFVVFAALPAALLITCSRPLSRRWCGREEPVHALPIGREDLLRIGLVLLGVIAVVDGIGFALSGAVMGAVGLASELTASLIGTATGTLARGIVQSAVGILLVRRAATWSLRWAAGARAG